MSSEITIAIYAMPRSGCIFEIRCKRFTDHTDSIRINLGVDCQTHRADLGLIMYDVGRHSPERGVSNYGWWLSSSLTGSPNRLLPPRKRKPTERFDSPIDALYTLETLHYAKVHDGVVLTEPSPAAQEQIAHHISRANYHTIFLMQGNHPELQAHPRPYPTPGMSANGHGETENGD